MTTTIKTAQLAPSVALLAPGPGVDDAGTFAILRDFFDGQPAGAQIQLQPGASYTCHGGAIILKPRQTLDLNGATVKRGNEIITTTTSVTAWNAASFDLAEVGGLQPGMYVVLWGVLDSDISKTIFAYSGADTNHHARIATVTAQNGLGNGPGSITLEAPMSSLANLTSNTIISTGALAAGAILSTKGYLIDACSGIAGTDAAFVFNGFIDGNSANNATAGHWESCIDLRTFTVGGRFDRLRFDYAAGEAIVTNGTAQEFSSISCYNVNGNAIHFNGWSFQTKLSQFYVDGCNLLASIGHSDGAITWSNNTFRVILHGIHIQNSRRGAIASFDSSDNAFAEISDFVIKDCWGPAFSFFSGSSAPIGAHIHNGQVFNSGISYFGSTRVSTTALESARDYNIHDVTFYDSMAYFAGLRSSRVALQFIHSDSATLTPSSVAAGRKTVGGVASNYGGTQTGKNVGGAGINTLSTGADLTAICQILPCEDSRFDISVTDRATAPTPATYNILVAGAVGLGGPFSTCRFDLKSNGGQNGIHLEGVLRNCTGYLEATGPWKTEAISIWGRAEANSAPFPAAAPWGVVGAALTGAGSGGMRPRTRYNLIFGATNQTVAPIGHFFVENGSVTEIVMVRPGAYSSNAVPPTLSFANAPGLSGASADAVLGPAPALNVSDNNDFKVKVHHHSAAGNAFGLKARQEKLNGAGCGWMTISGSVKFDAAAGGAVGLADGSSGQNSGALATAREPNKLRLDDLEITGPASGWTPVQLYSSNKPSAVGVQNPGYGRIHSLRVTGGYQPDVFWTVEDGAVVNLPA